MIKLKSFEEWFEDKITINEMAITKKKANDVVDGLGEQIYLHLIKIIYFNDEINYKKHIKDIDNCIIQIIDIKLKPKNNPIPKKHLYNWMFDDIYNSDRALNNAITRKLKDYKSLDILVSREYLQTKLENIYKRLVVKIEEDTFTSIDELL